MRLFRALLLPCVACQPATGVLFGGDTSSTSGGASTGDAGPTTTITTGVTGASAGSGTSTTSGGTVATSVGSTSAVTATTGSTGSTTGPGPDLGPPTSCAELIDLQQVCDDQTMELGGVLGIGCPGVPGLDAPPQISGHPDAWGLRGTLGDAATWPATEGTRYLVLGSGFASELDMRPAPIGGTGGSTSGGGTGGTGGDLPLEKTCTDQLGPSYDQGSDLPAPMTLLPATGDCLSMPAALGTGDCSMSLFPVLDPSGCADSCVNDYTEVRLSLTVPEHAVGLAFDVAFLTTEYPVYVGSIKDLFVAWLESPWWTGNTTYDVMPAALSPESDFLTIVDDAPELFGTCMKGHGATPWLTTTFPVTPGDQIELILAVFDNSDSSFDSFALIDGVRWTCDAPLSPETAVH